VASLIAAEADRIDADVIVIGSRRRGDLAALVLGSLTRDLLRRTTRPVLLAEASEHRETDAGAAPTADMDEAPAQPTPGSR